MIAIESGTREQKTYDNPENASCMKTRYNDVRSISRDEIKVVLKKIYAEETKPVNVRVIRNRTAAALMLVLFGTVIIGGMIGMKYLALAQDLMLIGLILLLVSLPLGFLVSTKYIRKIYHSMSRFKNLDSPSYRTALPKPSTRSSGVVFAVLLCVILLCIPTFNLLIFSNGNLTTQNDQEQTNDVEFDERYISLEKMILGVPYPDTSGQLYRDVVIEINNTIGYYSKNLVLEIQAWYTGKVYDTANRTLEKPDNDIILPIRIHESDDTTIKAFLKHKNLDGVEVFDTGEQKSVNDIYITKAVGKITKTSPFTKSIIITVGIYNDGPQWPEESVTLVVWKQSVLLPDYRGSVKNNETIKSGSFYEVTITFDIFDEESVFEVELKVNDEEKDTATVLSI